MDKPKRIEKTYNPMFEQTPLSDLFFSDYLPGLDPLGVKIYVYCVYLSKLNQEYTEDAIAKTLGIDKSVLMEKLIELEAIGLMSVQGGIIAVCDINQKELNRFYRKITSIMPDDVEIEDLNENQARNQVVKLISDRFFGGMMPGSWYSEIELWFHQYGFSPDAMYMLFQHCQTNGVMTKPYIRKVAQEWAKRNIKSVQDVEEYLLRYEKFRELVRKITNKLRLGRNLTEYEEEIVAKWFYTYKYDFDIIEIALKKSTSRPKFSIRIFDAMITEWFKNGLNTVDMINVYEEERRKKYAQDKGRKTKPASYRDDVPQMRNYEERQYDDEFFENLYKRKETK